MAGHRSMIKCKNNDPENPALFVSQHFNLPNHSVKNMKVVILESVKSSDTNDKYSRDIIETKWIFLLDTMYPKGLNRESPIPAIM